MSSYSDLSRTQMPAAVDVVHQSGELASGEGELDPVGEGRVGDVALENPGDDEQGDRADHHLAGVAAIGDQSVGSGEAAWGDQSPGDAQSRTAADEDGGQLADTVGENSCPHGRQISGRLDHGDQSPHDEAVLQHKVNRSQEGDAEGKCHDAALGVMGHQHRRGHDAIPSGDVAVVGEALLPGIEGRAELFRQEHGDVGGSLMYDGIGHKCPEDTQCEGGQSERHSAAQHIGQTDRQKVANPRPAAGLFGVNDAVCIADQFIQV